MKDHAMAVASGRKASQYWMSCDKKEEETEKEVYQSTTQNNSCTARMYKHHPERFYLAFYGLII